MAHPSHDEYWDAMELTPELKSVAVPALNIGGWYDLYIGQTLRTYTTARRKAGSAEAREGQRLIIGPWDHGQAGDGVYRDRSFGPLASARLMGMTDLHVKFYDRWLRGDTTALDGVAPVKIFVMGIDQWRDEQDWPLPDTQWTDYHLTSTGRANTADGGIIRDNRVEDITDEDWHAVIDVSLTGGFHCARAAFGPMKRQGYGRIVSFSSVSWRGNFGQTNYVAAKAGIVGMTRTLALEGARHGITANAIAPGLIETPMLASMNGPARDKLTNKIPMRHTGRPEDIAEAAAFLASEAAGYITGIVLDVDGGISIGSSIR